METFLKKYKIKSRLLSATGILLVLLLGLYLGRNILLRQIVNHKLGKAEEKYGLHITYASLRMPSPTQIQLRNFSIVPNKRDTLLQLNHLQINLEFWKLLTSRISIREVLADSLRLTFIKQDTLANYDFLFQRAHPLPSPADTVVLETGKHDFSRQISGVLRMIFGLLPHNGKLENLLISHRGNTGFTAIGITEMEIREGHFNTPIEVTEDTLQQHWIAYGELNKGERSIQATLHNQLRQKITLPYTNKYYNARIRFDTLVLQLSEQADRNGELTLQGDAGISGLDLFHQALSPEGINLDRGEIDYRIHAGKDFIELDSSSQITFNRLQFHPYLRAQKEKEWEITAAVNKPWFAAGELFESLPKGLFGNLDGLKASGELAYHFLLNIDFAQLDSLVLESELSSKNFRITRYGAGDLGKMAGEFLHTVYENGAALRTFPVGPSWEHFSPLDSIPVLLQTAILQSEDGGFFYHRGFLPDALREALIYDLKVKRFARGGSTISMQLIKNVFLTRHKNFTRKLEEALLVWLIESQRLTSKERMFEVYLNIVEWGPLIYGIREAADFYFDKRPSQLTPAESIFLASIIPKPKHFRNSFTEEMKLKESLAEYYRLICSRLVAKEILSEKEAAGILPEIDLKGKARQFFQPKDSTVQVITVSPSPE